MIEVPRGALRAGDLAKHADFFSFGTNDLTQVGSMADPNGVSAAEHGVRGTGARSPRSPPRAAAASHPTPRHPTPQMTCGFSRDDAEAKFLPLYVSQGIIQADPFEVGGLRVGGGRRSRGCLHAARAAVSVTAAGAAACRQATEARRHTTL